MSGFIFGVDAFSLLKYFMSMDFQNLRKRGSHK